MWPPSIWTMAASNLSSGARSAALAALGKIDPIGYGRSRNDLDGAVTRLSRYLRHGVLTLAEVRDVAIAKSGGAADSRKFLQELAWREYHQHVWRHLGERIRGDLENYKTGHGAGDYADELPADLLSADTGVDYVDYFVRELHRTGYLHNHARMWLAAYVVHARRIKWQAGARWFLSHLLDGDEASNNLSWQWCASTFSHKPYIFNRENVLKYSGNRFPLHQRGDPFDGDYESIAGRLFRTADVEATQTGIDFKADIAPVDRPRPCDPDRTAVWVHDGMLSPAHPAVALGASAFFLWDDAHIAASRHSQGRIDFQRSAIFCEDEHAGNRSLVRTVLEQAHSKKATTILTGDTADPRLRRAVSELEREIDIRWIAPEPLVEISGPVDLKRFSRYWSKVERRLCDGK